MYRLQTFDYGFLVPLISMLVATIMFNFRFYLFINAGLSGPTLEGHIYNRRLGLTMVFCCH